jgi:hypothetical protein
MLLIALILLGISSILYTLGLIPGTVRYMKKKVNPSKLSLDKLEESCDLLKEWKNDFTDKKFFSFRGMKSLTDLVSTSDKDKFIEFADACEANQRGLLVKHEYFKEEFDMNKLSLDNLDQSCALIAKWEDEIKNKKIITSDGIKSPHELMTKSDKDKFVELGEACKL